MKPFGYHLTRLAGRRWSGSIRFSLAALLVTGSAVCAQEVANTAKNIARLNCGAKIELVTAAGRPASMKDDGGAAVNPSLLITDDPTLSYALGEGETTFIISFPRTSLVDRFTFVNENAAAAGDLTVAVSDYQLPATSSKWKPVSGSVAFTQKRLFDLSMVGVEARYVKLSFRAEKAGRIASLGLYGGESLRAFGERNAQVLRGARDGGSEFGFLRETDNTDNVADAVNFNFANVYAKARVVYVSSGTPIAATRMIDDDIATSFRFAPTDLHPTAIIELARRERLHRVSTLFKMETGRLEVYLLDELKADPADLSGAKLAASMVERTRDGKGAVNFDADGARYVALRWTPEQTGRETPFEVAEIKAFGDVPLALLNLEAAPENFALNLSTAAAVPSLPPEVPVFSH